MPLYQNAILSVRSREKCHVIRKSLQQYEIITISSLHNHADGILELLYHVVWSFSGESHFNILKGQSL